ncbi:hypothetical protein PAXRUDRAFT_793330 [Paxillus rubicundulus Ve08.2h10]|uniref:Uncharacterized protein n=1 Tax=Paxillus rubicundulus Ve08.2h10 TaxID=930991 RepID=A0A0D0DZD4_9AGAM|nr:hypothetical protein PAXRUDRAFT_793330 [Paxillus rubicundulus Ve08.2h10]
MHDIMYEDDDNNQHSKDTIDFKIGGHQTYDSNTSDDLVHFIVQQQCQISQIVLGAILSVIKAIMVAVKTSPIPSHTSILTGARWVLELLNGHPE